MKIIVLGSGVIGVTSAYYLAKRGHEVTVVDRQEAPALETSHANAGQVSFGYSAPWAAPGIPTKAMKWLLQEHAPLKIQPKLDPAMMKWMMKMLANCNEASYAINKERMVRLAEYSRICIDELRDATGIAYDGRQRGLTQLFRTQQQMDASGKDTQVFDRLGVEYELLDIDGCIKAEPALARVKEKFAGGLRLPGDQTGDCFLFTQSLARMAEAMGVEFKFNTEIQGFVMNGAEIEGVQTSAGMLKADRYVVALGSYSPFLLNQIGIEAPIYPVKGYSLTIPITDPAGAPESTLMDETYKVAITRLGDRIRVGGTAELASYNLDLLEKRRKTIAMVVSDVFPDGGDIAKAEFWSGLRPMTPDGTPLVGGTQYKNLYLNTGHGTLGWTMSCGSSRLLADLIDEKDTDIDPQGLDITRYRKAA